MRSTIDRLPSGGHSPFGLCVWPRRERGVTWRGVERQKPLVASGGEATRGKKKKMTCVLSRPVRPRRGDRKAPQRACWEGPLRGIKEENDRTSLCLLPE